MGRGDFDATKQDLSTYEMDYYNTAAYLNHPFDIQVFIDFISRHLPYNIGPTLAGAVHIRTPAELETFVNQISGNIGPRTQNNRGSCKQDRVFQEIIWDIGVITIIQ